MNIKYEFNLFQLWVRLYLKSAGMMHCTTCHKHKQYNPIYMFVCAWATGEDVAYEHVHHHPAGLHCATVGGQVDRGLTRLPLHPHHDRAAPPPHPLPGL